MRNVLIAGQHSFIGTAVERRLAAFPGEYAATSLNMHGEDWKSFDFSPFDCVVHVAGIAHVSPKPEMRPLYEAVNRDLAVACARRAREMGVKQFLYLSSAIVFGDAAPAGEARSRRRRRPRPRAPTGAANWRPSTACARWKTSAFASPFCGR